ncbi:MAG: hypothetical protein ABEH88_08280 [Halobacteriales archaeon]
MYTGKLVLKQYLSNPTGFVRTILVFSVLVGLCLFFLSLPTMFTEIRVGPHDAAEYDLLVEGGITSERIERAGETESELLPVYQWGGDVSTGDGATASFESWIVEDMAAASEMTELNDRYLTEGAYEDGHAVVSRDLAESLGVGVGDRVTYHPAKLNETVEYEVSGIVRPGSHGRRTIVLGDTSGLIGRIASTTPAVAGLDNASTVYGAAYVDCADADTCEAVRDVFDSEATSVSTKEEQIKRQKEAVEQFTGSPVVRIAPIAGFLLYGLIYLRRSFLRADGHESTYGVLRSLGASRRAPIVHVLIDNAVVLALTTILGVVLATALYEHAVGIFVPVGPLLELTGLAVAANGAVVGVVSAVVVRRYANKEVVEMLGAGA